MWGPLRAWCGCGNRRWCGWRFSAGDVSCGGADGGWFGVAMSRWQRLKALADSKSSADADSIGPDEVRVLVVS